MELIEKVLTSLKLCQVLECSKCHYLDEVNDCQFQLLAHDAEIVINQLLNKNKKVANEEQRDWNICYGGDDC